MERLLTEENPSTIDVFVTDRNRQNAKYIRETIVGTRHYFDTWHVGKGNTNYILYWMRTWVFIIVNKVITFRTNKTNYICTFTSSKILLTKFARFRSNLHRFISFVFSLSPCLVFNIYNLLIFCTKYIISCKRAQTSRLIINFVKHNVFIFIFQVSERK
jgi:hypothetical protein